MYFSCLPPQVNEFLNKRAILFPPSFHATLNVSNGPAGQICARWRAWPRTSVNQTDEGQKRGFKVQLRGRKRSPFLWMEGLFQNSSGVWKVVSLVGTNSQRQQPGAGFLPLPGRYHGRRRRLPVARKFSPTLNIPAKLVCSHLWQICHGKHDISSRMVISNDSVICEEALTPVTTSSKGRRAGFSPCHESSLSGSSPPERVHWRSPTPPAPPSSSARRRTPSPPPPRRPAPAAIHSRACAKSAARTVK